MKILIELSKDMYDDIKDGYICQEYADDIINIVKNGTPIPDNATNGDVFCKIFNDLNDMIYYDEERRSVSALFQKHWEIVRCNLWWWNKLYKKGDKK